MTLLGEQSQTRDNVQNHQFLARLFTDLEYIFEVMSNRTQSLFWLYNQDSHGSLRSLKAWEFEAERSKALEVFANRHRSLNVLELMYFVEEYKFKFFSCFLT